ncbi:hypothetical protein SUGI_0029400 [Cryptomeria japonica]|nr:hypothetical protein SUGI_0029400 [Cryptomeria japonica]
MEFKGPEEKLQSCADHERKQCEGEKGRKRPAEDDNEDEVQEFFALVDRIHSMHKLYKEKPMKRPSAGKIPTSQNDGGSVIKRKSPWKPSFQWEDFSAMARNDFSFTCCSKTNARSSVVSEKSCIGVGNLDLNVEATAEK